MNDSTVRIEKIGIENFKNVRKGVLDLSKRAKSNSLASITGLYGQNGSGKTALIDAIGILKLALSGSPLPPRVVDYIQAGADHARLTFELSIGAADQSCSYRAEYRFSVRKDVEPSGGSLENREGHFKATLFDELLSCSYRKDDSKTKFLPVVDTSRGKIFGPLSKYKALLGSSRETTADMLVTKKLAAETSRSFVFHQDFIQAVQDNCAEEYLSFLFKRLAAFGQWELFVLHTRETGLVSMNGLPLFFRFSDKKGTAMGSIPLLINGPTLIPERHHELVKGIIANLNPVLRQLVPGLEIHARELGKELARDGQTDVKIQLTSFRDGNEIPLCHESEGIKKIISILQLLVVVYNQDDMTVAIDELDSGVFEYLLGEILRILSENGKGQLIFTSHNLRPLETLSPHDIVFTTTDPGNRYTRLRNIKTNNNLRDFYYRDIMLGLDTDDALYQRTNNNEIALAFREAGHHEEM